MFSAVYNSLWIVREHFTHAFLLPVMDFEFGNDSFPDTSFVYPHILTRVF